MTKRILMRTGDTSPSLLANLKTIDGNAIDLTGASVVFVMRHASAPHALVVDHRPAVVVNALQGLVRYDWQTGDTAISDTYTAGFVITFTDGTVRSVPSAPPDIQVVLAPTL